MKIALIGATGNVGSRLLTEALRRGHTVTAIARQRKNLPAGSGVTFATGDATQPAQLTPLLVGHDAVISAVRFQSVPAAPLISAVKNAGTKRFLVVGGAGSLEVSPGTQLVDTPDFPAAYKPEALAGRDFLNVLRGEQQLEWTFLSPAAEFFPGQRTGEFRIGGDELLVQSNGASKISMEDFAVAMLDELEEPQHVRQRFTVGY